ncbi:MAG: hypothetical protein ACKO37_04030 [Vampirovibrionales bacterium]
MKRLQHRMIQQVSTWCFLGFSAMTLGVGLSMAGFISEAQAETYRWQGQYTTTTPIVSNQAIVINPQYPQGCSMPYEVPQLPAPQVVYPPCQPHTPVVMMTPCPAVQTYVHTEVLPVEPRPRIIIREVERVVEVPKIVEVPKPIVKTVVKKVYVTRYVTPRKGVQHRPVKKHYAKRYHAPVKKGYAHHAKAPTPMAVTPPPAMVVQPPCQNPRVEAPVCVQCMPVHCYE